MLQQQQQNNEQYQQNQQYSEQLKQQQQNNSEDDQNGNYDNYKQIGNDWQINCSYMIGKGNFGKVYIGYHVKNLNKPLAVKVFEGQQALQQVNQPNSTIKTEFQCMYQMKSIQCPFIVKVHTIKKTSTGLYMFMDLCDGGNLTQFIQKKGQIGQLQSIDFLRQIVKGFQTLMENKVYVMHRDLKPDNIILNEGICRIADFGLGKIGQDLSEINCKEQHTLVGTPPYMSPQLLRSYIHRTRKNSDYKDQQLLYSNKCDIWALGLIFYEMLTGKLPWQLPQNKNLEAYLLSIEKDEIKIPDYWHPDIKDLITRMLQIEEENRISWQQIFAHPLVSKQYFEHSYKKLIQEIVKIQQTKQPLNLYDQKKQDQYQSAFTSGFKGFSKKRSLQNMNEEALQQIQLNRSTLLKLHEINQLILKQDRVINFNKQVQLDSYSFQTEISKGISQIITYQSIDLGCDHGVQDHYNPFQHNYTCHYKQFQSQQENNQQFKSNSSNEEDYTEFEPPLQKKVKVQEKDQQSTASTADKIKQSNE